MLKQILGWNTTHTRSWVSSCHYPVVQGHMYQDQTSSIKLRYVKIWPVQFNSDWWNFRSVTNSPIISKSECDKSRCVQNGLALSSSVLYNSSSVQNGPVLSSIEQYEQRSFHSRTNFISAVLSIMVQLYQAISGASRNLSSPGQF